MSSRASLGRLVLLAALCAGAVSAHEQTLPAYLKSLQTDSDAAAPPNRKAPKAGEDAQCRVTLRLADAATGAPVDGLVRVSSPEGTALRLPELFNRGTGLPQQHLAGQWHVVLGSAAVSLPPRDLVVEALSGLETELAKRTIDLSGRERYDLTMPLAR